jgi:hypothetical protein
MTHPIHDRLLAGPCCADLSLHHNDHRHLLVVRDRIVPLRPRHGWWVSRHFDDSLPCTPSEVLLGALQHSLAQGFKACPPIGLSLQ